MNAAPTEEEIRKRVPDISKEDLDLILQWQKVLQGNPDPRIYKVYVMQFVRYMADKYTIS